MKILSKQGLQFMMLFMLITSILSASHAYANDADQAMRTEIEQLLKAEPALKGTLAGISIRSAKTEEVLFEHNGDVRMRPASNLKLLTAATALSVLGEEHRFKTEMKIDGKRDGKTLHGNLYVKGYGDPTLVNEDLTRMAKELAQSGISKIDGDLIGDDSWFDEVRLSPDLVWSDEDIYYGAQISALTISPNKDYDTGTILVEVSPGLKVGEPVQIHITPNTNYVNIVNQGLTTSPDGSTDLTIDRKHGTNTIIVKGLLPAGTKKVKEWIAVWEPTKLVLEIFRQELRQQGVRVLGKAKTGETPMNATIVTSRPSIPLAELLVPFMKLSNNGHAEMLVKEMGKERKGEGSWEKGLEVLIEQLPQFGVDPATLVIRDGSGISHVDLVPANELTELLFHVQREKWFPSFLNALPVTGNSDKMIGGTLRKRMKSLHVKAKTGTLSTVSSLSGYVETSKGETVIFSILLNNLLDEERGKAIEDKIVKIIAAH